MNRSAIISVLLFVIVGCGSDPAQTEVERNKRFVGLWAIEHLTNAQFVATFYDFAPNGSLIVGSGTWDDCDGLSDVCGTGFVRSCAWGATDCEYPGVTCSFGDEWRSAGPADLIIASNCSDGLSRDVHLTFSPDTSSNSEGGSGATVLEVDGETGWEAGAIWAFLKCPAGADESACREKVSRF
ncbi:MAG: hypothetical protein JKY56_07960 [Kofleriaceae bacterium]|nr:hypothetical protein [Kofleriaceae bacterium]